MKDAVKRKRTKHCKKKHSQGEPYAREGPIESATKIPASYFTLPPESFHIIVRARGGQNNDFICMNMDAK